MTSNVRWSSAMAVAVVEEETVLLVRDVGVLSEVAIDVPLLILTTVMGLPHGRMLDNGCVADEGDEWLMMMRLVHAGFVSLPILFCEEVREREREREVLRLLLPPSSSYNNYDKHHHRGLVR